MATNSAINSNQTLKTTDSPTFGGGTYNGQVTFNATTANGINLQIPNSTGQAFFQMANSSGFMALDNNSSNFAPAFQSTLGASTDVFSIVNEVTSANDTGSVPMLQLVAENTGGGALSNRPLLAVFNATNKYYQISANGNSLFGANLDVISAGNWTIGASVGSNTLTLAGSSSVVNVPGTLTSTPYYIFGQIISGSNTLSVSAGNVTNVITSNTVVTNNNGISINGSNLFIFSNTGLYLITYNFSYQAAAVSGFLESYFTQNSGGSDTGNRFAYKDLSWNNSSVFPTNLSCTDVIRITNTSNTYRLVTFQQSGATQTIGNISNAQQMAFSIVRISN